MTEEHEEPKLIIDEDWKTQVQREKKELEERKAEEAQSGDAEGLGPEDAVTDAGDASPPEGESTQELPPASIMLLATSLGTQAMASLGLMPAPDGGTMQVNLPFAKHFIDLIAVLEEKTKGNLTEEENSYMQDTLYQLRMAFIEVKKNS